MAKQRPATIAEVDARRGRAALALRVAQRRLLSYIKKGTEFREDDPARGREGQALPGGREGQGEVVHAGLRSGGEVDSQTRGSRGTSALSSVTSEKLETNIQAMRTCFEELCLVHQELVEALNSLDPNQEVLEGYPEYEETAMEDYIMNHTDKTTELEQQADEVVRVLRDVFSPLRRTPRPIELTGLTALQTSEERGLQNSDLSALSLTEAGTRRKDSTRHNLLSLDLSVQGQDGLLGSQQEQARQAPLLPPVTNQHEGGNLLPQLGGRENSTTTQEVTARQSVPAVEVRPSDQSAATSRSLPLLVTRNDMRSQQRLSLGNENFTTTQPQPVAANQSVPGVQVRPPDPSAAASQFMPVLETRDQQRLSPGTERQYRAVQEADWVQEQALTMMIRAKTQLEDTLQRLSQELECVEEHTSPLVLDDLTELAKDARAELQKLMEAQENRARVCPPDERSDVMSAGNSDYRWYQSQIRDLQARIREKRAALPSSRAPPEGRPGARYAQLERVGLPEFDGSHENWPLFMQEWHDLQEGQGRSDAVQFRELRSKIPASARELVAGIGPQNGGIKAAFDRLQKQYGDKEVNILQIQRRLDNLVLKKREQHEKVEELCQEVDRATNLLRTLGAEDKLERDYSLVGRLVGKLPMTFQQNWDEFVTSPGVAEDGSSEWRKFTRWLETRRLQALNAKKRHLQQTVQESVVTKDPISSRGTKGESGTQRCFRCNQPGHLSRSCKQPVTRVPDHSRKDVNLAKVKSMDEFKVALP